MFKREREREGGGDGDRDGHRETDRQTDRQRHRERRGGIRTPVGQTTGRWVRLCGNAATDLKRTTLSE